MCDNMFSNCTNLINIPALIINNCFSSQNMFTNCFKLKDIDMVVNIVNSGNNMFNNCRNLINAPIFNAINYYSAQMFNGCVNLVNVPYYNLYNARNIIKMFEKCNNLSDDSIQNIINMCLSTNRNRISSLMANLAVNNMYSPFCNTNITNDRYQNRWAELTAAGWKY